MAPAAMSQTQAPSTALAPIRVAPIEKLDLATEYLSFRIGPVSYAIDILSVKEIRSYDPPMPLPNAPPSVVGVVNLRGDVVPIVDLAALLRGVVKEPDASTVVIVTAVGQRVVGWLVDAVSDVVELNEEDMRPAPRCFTIAGQVIERLALLRDARGEKLLTLLEVQALMRSADLQTCVVGSEDRTTN